jgi:hypothetical protein
MSFKTVSEYKDSVAALLSGIDLGNVDNLNGALERAARILIQKADVPEASITQNITLYNGVTEYLCDERIFGTSITDIRPQGVSRNITDYVYKVPQEQFDRTKGYLPNGTRTTFTYKNGTPIINIESTTTIERVVIDTMTDDTGWTASGNASSLVQDTAIYYQEPGSLRFNLTTGTGTLTKNLSSQLDMSSYQGFGTAFLALQIPTGATATNLTSIQVKIGSSSTAYSAVTETEGFLGAWVAGEWLLVAFDFSGATDTGIPDWSVIDYVQVNLSTAGSFTNFHLGGLWMSFPSQNQILAGSAAIYLPAGLSTTQTTITSDTDSIILNDAAYTIYEIEGALSVLQQTGGGASDSTSLGLQRKLDGNGSTDIGLYARYRGDNPSQELRTVGSYYDNSTGYNFLN